MKIRNFIRVFSRDQLPYHTKYKKSAIVNMDSTNNTGNHCHCVTYNKIRK